MRVAKTKALISFAVTSAPLVSHMQTFGAAAHMFNF